ncbi:hypothetical protein A2U01_0116165, partial [Trifolium medium]|nr:hypothetical protein [Trifolium medium]
ALRTTTEQSSGLALSPSESWRSPGETSQNPTSHLARPGDTWRDMTS